MVHQIEAQVQLVENNFPANAKLAQQHANIAISLLNQNGPIVNQSPNNKKGILSIALLSIMIDYLLNSSEYYKIE